MIVEGSDGTGKTVFCHKLLKKLQREGPWIYSHFSKLPTTWRHPASYFPRMSTFIVQDRFHMSDLAYRHARFEAQMLSPFAYSLVDAKLRQLGGMTVVLTAPVEIIRGNYKGAGDMHDVECHFRANNAFEKILTRASPFGEYVVDHDFLADHGLQHGYPSDDFVDEVVEEYLRRMKEFRRYSNNKWMELTR